MKRISTNKEEVIFCVDLRERAILQHVLQMYPVVPASHAQISKNLKGAPQAESQRLLDEALAEQRADHKRRLKEWLGTPNRFEKTEGGYRFRLQCSDIEWLLQVLNDVRVGSWLKLGSPELENFDPHDLDAEKMPDWVTMEASAYFQISILEASRG